MKIKISQRKLVAAAGPSGASHAALELPAAPPVTPSGLIDCQSHLFCPELLALMEKRDADVGRAARNPRALVAAKLSAGDVRKICYLNAKRLFNL